MDLVVSVVQWNECGANEENECGVVGEERESWGKSKCR